MKMDCFHCLVNLPLNYRKAALNICTDCCFLLLSSTVKTIAKGKLRQENFARVREFNLCLSLCPCPVAHITFFASGVN